MSVSLAHSNGENNNRDVANGKLIAAAPDMLEALENLKNDDGSIPDHAWRLVKDSIAKAMGSV